MAKLRILEFPDPRLRKKAAPVEVVDDPLRQLIDDMFETMYEAPGIGLAATQVDVHRRLLVADVSQAKDEPHVLINRRFSRKTAPRSPRRAVCRCRAITKRLNVPSTSKCVTWMVTAMSRKVNMRVYSPFVYNMKWIISKANYLSITCRKSNVSEFANDSRKTVANFRSRPRFSDRPINPAK